MSLYLPSRLGLKGLPSPTNSEAHHSIHIYQLLEATLYDIRSFNGDVWDNKSIQRSRSSLRVSLQRPLSMTYVCCHLIVRLKPFLNDGANGQVLRSLSYHGCLLYFLDWVKTSRRNASDIDAEELLMCPMLWCRKRMKDADGTLRHISKCSHLSNGYYWCPHCRGPERFVEHDQGRENVPKTRLHKIDKTLAIKFFKWLIPRRSFKKTGNRSDASETASSDVSSSELLSPQRANRLSLQEMFGSTPSDLAGRGSDTIYSRDHGTQMFVLPNGIFDDPVSTDIEFPYGDPVYYTTELRDRTSFNFASAQHANSSTNSSGLQAGSSHGRACPDATIHGKKFIRDSRLVVDRLACSSSYDCYKENADTCASTPSGLQTTPPSTPSSSLIFPLSSVPSSGSPASTLTSPMSNDCPGTSWARVVPKISTAAHIKDSNYALRPRSSTFAPAELEETHSQGPLAKANTAPASDLSRCFGYSGSERRHIPFQFQSPGAEADSRYLPYLSGPPAETRIQVQELLDLIPIINKEWVEGLCLGYEVHRRCSSLSARLLFAKGINTLTWEYFFIYD